MEKRIDRFSFLWVILFHSVSFTLALSPVLLGGAFGNAEARLGVYPHATLIAQKLFSTDIFWNDLNAWRSISAPFGYEYHPALLFFLLFLTPITAIHALTLLYTIIAATCGTLFLRKEGWSSPVSILGGTTYAFVLWSWIFEPCISVVPPLLGITVLAYQRCDRHPIFASLVASVSLGLLWAGSHMQFAVMAFLLSWLYLISVALRSGRWLRFLSVGIAASLMGIIIALPRLLPLIAHVMLSSRVPITSLQTIDFHLPFFLFLPRVLFHFSDTRITYQLVPYMGAFVSACILLALMRFWRDRMLRVLVCLAVAPAFLSLPGFSALLLRLPFVSLLGTPERWLYVSMVVLVPVACMGFDAFTHREKRGLAHGIGFLFGGLGVALLFLITLKCAVTGPLLCIPQSHLLFPSLSLILTGIIFLVQSSRPVITMVLGVLSILLVLFGMTLEWRIPARAVFGTPLFIPQSAQEIVHVFAARSGQPASLSPRARALYDDTLWYADTNILSGVALTAVNDPTLSSRTQTVLDMLGGEPPFSPAYLSYSPAALTDRLRAYDYLLPALGIRWVLSPVRLDNFTTLELTERIPIEGEVMVYRYAVRHPRPPVYVLSSVLLQEPSVVDLPERLRGLKSRQQTLVECIGCHGEYRSSGAGIFKVREESPAHLYIDVDTPEDQWMAIRNIALPGAQVSIDGRLVPYAIAHGLLLAVHVPVGKHVVTVERSYVTLLKDSVRILRGNSCLWCLHSRSGH